MTQPNGAQHNSRVMLQCHILFTIILNVVMLNVIMLSVNMLSVVMLNVAILNVVMLSVVATIVKNIMMKKSKSIMNVKNHLRKGQLNIELGEHEPIK
jgi:hypothetical protein